MSERRDNRKQIANRNIISLHKEGNSIKAISKLTGKSELHVRNTINRCDFSGAE